MSNDRSILDIALENDSGVFNFGSNRQQKSQIQSYSGTIGQALNACIGGFYRYFNLQDTNVNSYELVELVHMFSRVTRGIILCKGSRVAGVSDHVKILEEACSIGIRLYSLDDGVLKDLVDFSVRISDILDIEVMQKVDAESWKANNPTYSVKSLEYLFQEIGRDDYVFIVLCNGGFIPGIDIYRKLKFHTGEKMKHISS